MLGFCFYNPTTELSLSPMKQPSCWVIFYTMQHTRPRCQLCQQQSFHMMVTPFASQDINWFHTEWNLIWCLYMFYNLSTIWLLAGYASSVSHCIFQLRVKCEAAVWGSQFPGEQQPINCSDLRQHINLWQPKHHLAFKLTKVGLFLSQQFLECIFYCLCDIYREKHTKNHTYASITNYKNKMTFSNRKWCDWCLKQWGFRYHPNTF